MNEDIIRMAREAGMGGMLTDVVCTHAELERFAALVRADEREACAKACEQSDRHRGPYFASLIRERGRK